MSAIGNKQVNGMAVGDKRIGSLAVGGVRVYKSKNMYNKNSALNNMALKWTDGMPFSENKSVCSDYVSIQPNTQYTCNFFIQRMYYDINHTYLGNGSDLRFTASTPAKAFTSPNNSNIKYLRIGVRTNDNGGLVMYDQNIQLELGSAATLWEPY